MQEYDLNNILNKCYPYIKNILLTGSYAEERENTDSDIDLILIDDWGDFFYKESMSYNETIVQFLVYPLNRLNQFISIDYLSCEGILISMIAKGRILRDDSGYLSEIQLRCRNLFRTGPPKLSIPTFNRKLIELENNLSDLKNGPTHYEKIFIANDIFRQAAELIAIEEGIWIFSKKHLARLLSEIKSSDLSKLVNAYQNLVKNNAHTDLLEFAFGLIKQKKISLQHTTTRSIFSFVSEGYIAIQIAIVDSIEITISTKLNFFSRLLSTYKVPVYFFRSPSLIKQDNRYECLYLVARGKNELLEQIIHSINTHIIKDSLRKELGGTITYPVDINHIYGFLSKELLQNIESILITISAFIGENKPLDVQFFTAVHVLAFIVDKLIAHEDKADFLVQYFENQLVKSYDSGRLSNKEQLSISKLNLTNSFQTFFREQRRLIKDFGKKEHVLISTLCEKLEIDLYKLKKVSATQNVEEFYFPPSKTGFKREQEEVIAIAMDRIMGAFMISDEQKAYTSYILKQPLRQSGDVIL